MKKFILIFLVLITVASSVLPAFAVSGDEIYSSSALKDLSLVYDLNKDYPIDSADDKIYLITAHEYGYKTSEHALYLYFYNPSCKDIVQSQFNTVQLATSWDENENADIYSKFKMRLVNVSPDKRFIKCSVSKITDTWYLLKDSARSYFISGFEMTDSDTTGCEDYTAGCIFTFSGEGENLTCQKKNLITVRLDVNQVSYLTGDSAKGEGYSNQINSVYFSLPKTLENDYGSLYAVNFEYYKYRSMPMVLTDNSESYSVLKNVGWVKCNEGEYLFGLGESTRYKATSTMGNVFYTRYLDICFGNKLKNRNSSSYSYDDKSRFYDYLPIVFPVDEILDKTTEESRRKVLVSSDEIQKYFEEYLPLSGRDEIPVNYSGIRVGSHMTDGGIGYNGDLFNLDYFDNYEKINKTLSLDDTITLKSFMDVNEKNTLKFILQGKWGYVINPEDYDKSIHDLPALEKVTSSDFLFKEKTEVSDELCVSLEDLDGLINSVADNSGYSTYLLRYAWSDDYYCNDMSADGLDGKFLVAEETVYIDFDIISLSFKDKGEKVTVIPVVSDMTDGFTGIQNATPNHDFGDNAEDKLKDAREEILNTFRKLLSILFVIIFVMFVFSILKSIFKHNNVKKRT